MKYKLKYRYKSNEIKCADPNNKEVLNAIELQRAFDNENEIKRLKDKHVRSILSLILSTGMLVLITYLGKQLIISQIFNSMPWQTQCILLIILAVFFVFSQLPYLKHIK